MRKMLMISIFTVLLIQINAQMGLCSQNIRTGKASWYSSDDACGKKTNNHPGCPTASGKSLYQLERDGVDFVAMNNVRMGTKVRVTNIKNNFSVIATVLDRGGFEKYGRIADLGKKTFAKLSPTSDGIITVRIERI